MIPFLLNVGKFYCKISDFHRTLTFALEQKILEVLRIFFSFSSKFHRLIQLQKNILLFAIAYYHCTKNEVFPLRISSLVTFTEEILNEKLHFFCAVSACHHVGNTVPKNPYSRIFYAMTGFQSHVTILVKC